MFISTVLQSESVTHTHILTHSFLDSIPIQQGFPYGSAGKESTCNVGDLGLTPGLGRSPGEGKDYPLQYSSLENSNMDYTVHGVAKSWTWLSDFYFTWASLVAQMVKSLPAVQDTWVRSLDQEDPLEKEMATHSSILAWKIPWTEEPGRLQSMGSHRVGHDWATLLSFTFTFPYSKETKPVNSKGNQPWIFTGRTDAEAPILWPPDVKSQFTGKDHGIFQARILEWVAMPFSKGSSWLRDWTCVSCIAGRFFTTEPTGKPVLYIRFLLSILHTKILI